MAVHALAPNAPPSPRPTAIVDPRIGNHGPALLALEDGSIFDGVAFGAPVAGGAQLARLLRDAAIPAIAGVDTRALARHLRSNGSLRGEILEPGALDRDAAITRARAVPRWEDQDFVAAVSPAAVVEHGTGEDGPLVAIVDLGLKSNIVRSLRRRGVRVRVLPHTSTAADVLG